MVHVLTSSSHMSFHNFRYPKYTGLSWLAFLRPLIIYLSSSGPSLVILIHLKVGTKPTAQDSHTGPSNVTKWSPCSWTAALWKSPIDCLPMISCKAFPAPFWRVQFPQTGPARLGPRVWIYWHCTEPLWIFHGMHSPKYSEKQKSSCNTLLPATLMLILLQSWEEKLCFGLTLEGSWPWALIRSFSCPQALLPLSSAHPRKCPNTPLPTGLYQRSQTEGNPSPSHWWTVLVGPPAQSSTVRGSEDNLEHLPVLWVTHGKPPESPNSRALKGGANNASSGHVSSCLVVGEHWPHTPLQNSQKSLLCV